MTTTKVDLRASGVGATDRVGEHLASRALDLVGLHPFDLVPEDGDTLPAPHEDSFGNDLGPTSGDAIYYLTHGVSVALGVPVMRPGRYDGQRVRLSPTAATLTITGGARGAGAPVPIAPGEDRTLIWDDARGEWVLSGGGAGGGGGGDVFGPGSSVDDNLCTFNGTTGKIIQDSGVALVTVTSHVASTANPHSTGLANLGSGTLAQLNALVTDATLDDASSPRTPTAHASTHENGGSDEINVAGLSGLLADPQTPATHAASHADGGSDEIVVEGLATAETNTSFALMPDGAGGLVWGATAGAGDVIGPASSTDDRLALFDGTTGKLLKEGTVTGTAVASHLSDTANPHSTDVGNLGSGTLAELNAAITDATLDSASSPRPPTAHAASHADGGSDEIVVEGLATASSTTTHVLSPNGSGGLVFRAESAGGAADEPVVYFGGNNVGATTTTRYLYPGYDDKKAGVTVVEVIATRAGTLRNLFVRHGLTAGNGNTITYTVLVNGAATGITVGLASTSSQASDTVNTQVIAAGDRISIRATKAASVVVSPRRISASVELAA